MNKKIISMAVFLLMLSPLLLSGEELIVDYVEGFVEVHTRDGWVEVFIGDIVDEDSSIRLEPGSLLELSGTNIHLTLTTEGTYSIQDLIKSSTERSTSGVGSLIANKLLPLGGSSSVGSRSAVGGVRGDFADEETFSWVESEAAELIERGKQLLSESDFEKALEVFKEAYDFAYEDEVDEVLYYLGYSSYLLGDIISAERYLSQIDVKQDSSYYSNLILLKGNIYLETFAYQKAISLFDNFLTTERGRILDPSLKQTVYLMEAMAFQGLGNREKTIDLLTKTVEIDNLSEAGKTAERLLNQLKS